MARWHAGKEGGKAPPDAFLIQMALKFHTTPDVVEDMPAYWFNRMALWMETEAEGEKLRK
jgi:hypothetical protein